MNMNDFSQSCAAHRFGRFRIVALIVTGIAVVLRTLNLVFFFEADIGYYRAGAPLPTLFPFLIAGAVLFFAIFSRLFLRRDVPLFQAYTKPLLIVSFLTALSFGFAFFMEYSSMQRIVWSWTSILPLLGAGAGTLYFLLFGIKKHAPISALLCGAGSMLWFALSLYASYVDLYVTMNSPEKLGLQLACLGGLLLLLAEIRLLCDVSKSAFSAFSHGCAALFLLVGSIPSLIAQALDRLPSRNLWYADIVFLALGVFALLRLFSPFRDSSVQTDPEMAEGTEEIAASDAANDAESQPEEKDDVKIPLETEPTNETENEKD